MKQTGMTVSNLNIAQVRRNCGLDMRENYHLSEPENEKQPECS
ncbi:MAG: RNA methyltransferase [Lachnospiraceae bacterium]|nr:RNA methyltransferase [Lachnospiraceae bacterium]